MFTIAQTFAMILLIAAGVWLGRRAGRAKRSTWFVGFLIPLGAIALVIVGHRSVRLSFVPPFSWAIDPWMEPPLMALAIPVMLSTLIVRLPEKRKRMMVGLLTGVMVAYYALLPVVLPVLMRRSLAAEKTHIGSGGVCRQSHSYTCGPASAVTCLGVLGVRAGEGPLAIAAGSSPALGTDPILLARAINNLYGSAGIHCAYRDVRDLNALTVPAIATIISPAFGGHYVAVLEVTPNDLWIGDPLGDSREKWTREEFMAEWTGAAHEFTVSPERRALQQTVDSALSPVAASP